jgi:hypothetical protein
MPAFSNDPRWILTRRPGTCGKCHREYPSGTRAFYYPLGKKTYYTVCAALAAQDFAAAADDDIVSALG